MAGYGKPPETKSELVQMTAEGNIVLPSGTLDCTQCNIFPHARKWLEVRSPDDTLSVYYLLELCLQHYEFHILDNAFLVQVQEVSETIKDVSILKSFIQHNNQAREKKVEDLLCRYGSDTGCSI
ncbi:beta-1,4-glucuronyltransferase 1 [Caerostris extrusa]|uniref:Beta-1,4-glucuronyltransferase 1 n=1 Tax=Caerostris extrusa TaxID=172846 RepID=A0AAV4QBD7_CAEEX|nr:beta-1,4-glucuronyltransferase 1 [Caerostris extrusa]